jgi:tetratricopeptide repeat protein
VWQTYSEPLAGTAWWLFGRTVRALSVPPRPEFFGLFSVLCGLAAAVFGVAILREAKPRESGWAVPLALFLTLGSAELYCGYIEAYPPVWVAVLAYLWLGVRHARGACSSILLGFALAVAIASHFAALFLVPSYLYLLLRARPRIGTGLLLGILPLALALAFLLLIGTGPEHWLVAVRIATRAVGLDASPTMISAVYPVFSLAHARDLGNEIALVMPLPAILGGAALASRRGRAALRTPEARFLLIGALAGLASTGALALPTPAAQDWDLHSLFLIPAAVLAIVVGVAFLSGRSGRRLAIGVSALSLGSCLSFVLVNASEPAGLARYLTLLDPAAPIPKSTRAYPYSLLAAYYEDKGDDATALRYSRLTLESEPTNPRYWLKVGTELYRLGRIGEAIPTLEEARRRGPQSADARHNLGMAYAKSGRVVEGVAELRAAVAMERDDPELYYDLGVGYALAGSPDSTRAIWERIRLRWPGYAPAARGLREHFGVEVRP